MDEVWSVSSVKMHIIADRSLRLPKLEFSVTLAMLDLEGWLLPKNVLFWCMVEGFYRGHSKKSLTSSMNSII